MTRISIALVATVILLSDSLVGAIVPFTEMDQRILDCNVVMQNLLQMPDKTIPRDLLNRCRGLAIFPRVVKVGAIVGFSFGKGAVLRRDEQTGQWSKPAFFKIRSGSFGPQVGAQSVDLILLVMNEKGVQGMLEDRFTLGADMSITAGPMGRDASAETNLGFEYGILSYSRTRGLFAGISLTGAAMEPDREANEAYHGAGVSVQDVFYEGKGVLSDNAKLLVETLDSATR